MKHQPWRDYLCVDQFMNTAIAARTLETAFELGVIDCLIDEDAPCLEDICQVTGQNTGSLSFLLEMLESIDVLNKNNGYTLTEEFNHALEYRDILESKLAFSNFAAVDFIKYFSDLIRDPNEFMQHAEMFRLFDYGRCFEDTEDNIKYARRWMAFTTMLTRYEGRACAAIHDFGQYKSMLDIGGNSGEFCVQVCKSTPDLKATVFDLPVVCKIGVEHVGETEVADRISFVKGDALEDELPTGFDLVSFKSVLHDWPDDYVVQFLKQAYESIMPGGNLIIFERAPFKPGEQLITYSHIPLLLFSNTLRQPDFYVSLLEEMGCEITIETVELDMPFFLITARRPGD